ncbi:MAG: hypothetical protein ACKPKO_63500, partial [Candidatus Fonsibacter sp.]
DKIKPKRIKLDDSLHTDPIKVQEFRESVCIFDDIDVISDKKIREVVYNTLNQILEIGRHFKIHCIVTNHLPTNGKDTRGLRLGSYACPSRASEGGSSRCSGS